MSTLSTNCLYYQAYVVLEGMAQELHHPLASEWKQKARRLKDAITIHFWNEDTRTYRYLVDDVGTCDAQEGLGYAFALLFDLASEEQAAELLQNHYRTPQGLPCIWPPFKRYSSQDGQSFGRHCGVIWPHIQAFWAQAVAQRGRADLLAQEMWSVAEKACRDNQFAEIYHPLTGEIYGGLQEGCIGEPEQYLFWKACSRQSWSASGYLRMLLMSVLGMNVDASGILFRPTLPAPLEKVIMRNLPYRLMHIDVEIYGSGPALLACTVNGQTVPVPALSAQAQGHQHLVMHWGSEREL